MSVCETTTGATDIKRRLLASKLTSARLPRDGEEPLTVQSSWRPPGCRVSRSYSENFGTKKKKPPPSLWRRRPPRQRSASVFATSGFCQMKEELSASLVRIRVVKPLWQKQEAEGRRRAGFSTNMEAEQHIPADERECFNTWCLSL